MDFYKDIKHVFCLQKLTGSRVVPCITNLYYECTTGYNNKQSIFYFTARLLYMFQVPFTHIIRCTWNCSYSHWYKSYISV